MSTLPTALRRQLERVVSQARTTAEAGARHALEALATHEPRPYKHMDEAQCALRRQLRAQARQLGDREHPSKPDTYELTHLIEKVAYDHWHRMLFARYLLENGLLISPDHGVAVTLDDCEELAPSLGGRDGWAVAARFAARELPEIFRGDDPAGAVDLPVEDRKPLVALVTGLPVEVFTSSDSLGWCYQFWQAEKKDEVNKAGNKIGADELPSVTQLFTEDYMVDFLLDNTLGAWRAGKVLAANPGLADSAQSEDELRQAVALPGCPWTYLRFITGEDGRWKPAAGTFDGWPRAAKELTCLDPCMGSGHFVVAIFERLVALRLAEEALDDATAVAAVIRDNLFGLEIDPRCTQIGAFNLALAAWRRVGHCALPPMNLACSGLAPNAKQEDWLKLAGDDEKLQNGMARLYRLFKDAPVLGSLINPRSAGNDLLVAAFHELQPLLEGALSQERNDDAAHEMTVTARGLAKAAEVLAGQFTLVATNVPYLGRGKQGDVLRDYCERVFPDAQADLATCFVERSLGYCTQGGSVALVTPQNWWFIKTYVSLRRRLLSESTFRFTATLGEEAWQSFGNRGPVASLVVITRKLPNSGNCFPGLNPLSKPTIQEKTTELISGTMNVLAQADQLRSIDHRISVFDSTSGVLLGAIASSFQGVKTGDDERACRGFWEIPRIEATWRPFQSSPSTDRLCGGMELLLYWGDEGKGLARRQGLAAWGSRGVLVSQMRSLSVTRYFGDAFAGIVSSLVVQQESHIAAVWAFCTSSDYKDAVRKVDTRVSISNGNLVNVRFDLQYWQGIAAEKYPNGLPRPFSSDPTQWLFNGNPVEADQPLQVAVARLLGYKWPRQTGSSFPDCPALESDGLERFADDDGIVCLSPTKGEASAAERLRELLAHAYGTDWTAARQEDFLTQVDCGGMSLDDWLRTKFFEQHCALFHQHPFIWHIWDGHKSGFGALVNYHTLTHANLEKLTFAYLGDWIRRQQAAVDAGEAGSDSRLEAARSLQSTLTKILEGEPPYDIFVRWKPLSRQAVGWYPDLNDGVRVNIRPFMSAPDVGKRGAGVLRAKPNIKWDKDRGKEPLRDKAEFPWFWSWDGTTTNFLGGREFDGSRWNDCHYSNATKRNATELTPQP